MLNCYVVQQKLSASHFSFGLDLFKVDLYIYNILKKYFKKNIKKFCLYKLEYAGSKFFLEDFMLKLNFYVHIFCMINFHNFKKKMCLSNWYNSLFSAQNCLKHKRQLTFLSVLEVFEENF